MPEKIVPVNGYWIRQTRDTDFAIWHRHAYPGNTDYSRKEYVPEGENWVDHRQINELSFLLRTEKKYFSKVTGDAYNQKRIEVVDGLKHNRHRISEFIVSQKEKTNGLLIVYIDGSKVRHFLDPEFVQGGHGFVYEYIPKDPRQIWIDATMDPRDWPHVEAHEVDEEESMSNGEDYEPAHQKAMRIEISSRIAAGGSYPGFETPLGFTPEQLRALYFDLTK